MSDIYYHNIINYHINKYSIDSLNECFYDSLLIYKQQSIVIFENMYLRGKYVKLYKRIENIEKKMNTQEKILTRKYKICQRKINKIDTKYISLIKYVIKMISLNAKINIDELIDKYSQTLVDKLIDSFYMK